MRLRDWRSCSVCGTRGPLALSLSISCVIHCCDFLHTNILFCNVDTPLTEHVNSTVVLIFTHCKINISGETLTDRVFSSIDTGRLCIRVM